MPDLISLKTDLNTALKAGESRRVLVLRMLLSELNYKAIEIQRELALEDISGVIRKEIKKRRESIEAFTQAGRKDRVSEEQAELEILSLYLPAQLSAEEIKQEISRHADWLSSPEFGAAMRQISGVFKGRADGSLVAQIVREMLAEKYGEH